MLVVFTGFYAKKKHFKTGIENNFLIKAGGLNIKAEKWRIKYGDIY